MHRSTVAVLCIVLASTASAATDTGDWQPMTGAATLQKFVAGATAEIQLQPGVTAIGTYNADGTAEIHASNETFERT